MEEQPSIYGPMMAEVQAFKKLAEEMEWDDESAFYQQHMKDLKKKFLKQMRADTRAVKTGDGAHEARRDGRSNMIWGKAAGFEKLLNEHMTFEDAEKYLCQIKKGNWKQYRPAPGDNKKYKR